MFHLMLGLPVLLVAAAVIAVILFGIFMIVASIVGGGATALLVKNEAAKRLLFVGLCIASLIGMVCIIPVVAIYVELSGLALTLAMSGAFVCIMALSVAGIKLSGAVQNNIGSRGLKIVFVLVLIVSAFGAVLAPIVRWLLGAM